MTPTPIVLIEIDADSRLVIRQTSGVRVAFIDQRVDGDHVAIFNERDQMDAIIAGTGHITTKEHAYTLMYGMHRDPPDAKILDVFLCKLRRKLAPHDIAIITVWGRGWYMEPEDRAKVELLRFRPEAVVA